MSSKFEVLSENFDLFFANELEKITPDAKDLLPSDVVFKLFRKGGEVNAKGTSRLSFIAKLYILIKCLRKRFYIVVEDDVSGIKLSQFNDIPRLIKERDLSVPNAKDLSVSGGFLLGSAEVMTAYSYLNNLSASPAYNYISKAKNSVSNGATQEDKAAIAVTKMLIGYESNKKDLVSKTGLNMPEIYVLLLLYPGKEIQSSSIYHETFKRAYQSSPNKIKAAFSTLQQRKFIEKYGTTKKVSLKITPLGRDLVRGILDKYVLNT